MKKLYNICALSLAALALWSCAEEADSSVATEKFTSIFDARDFDANYKPIDIVQVPDGGYVVLSARTSATTDYSAIHLLKADANGNFKTEVVVSDTLVHPISSLTVKDNKLYFICMNTTTAARIVSLDQELGTIEVNPINGLTYPSAANYIPEDNAFALLGYNSEDKETLITVANLTGTRTQPLKTFTTGNGGGEIIIDQIMIEHFLHNGKHFPFSVGKLKPGGTTGYYFNAFVNYNFSMGFTNLSETDEGTFVFGENDDSGFSAINSLGNGAFAIARFHFGDTYLFPKASLSTTSPVNLADYNAYPELEKNAMIRILPTEIEGKNVIIYGSDTKSKQIGLFFYDASTTSFMTSRYLGFSNPYEFSSLVRTKDEGLAVCGTTYLAGRFPRICIFKLSKDDLKENVVLE